MVKQNDMKNEPCVLQMKFQYCTSFTIWIYDWMVWLISLFVGLLSWNVLECHVDLEEELNNLTNHAPEGEAARHGDYL